MHVVGTPMPKTPCGIETSCVWQASQRLTNTGRKTTPTDLCIAIASNGDPCGVRAVTVLGEEATKPGQPFCEKHLGQLVRGIEHHLPSIQNQTDTAAYRPASRKLTTDHIYFARRKDAVKIGHSKQWRVRIRGLELSGGSPFDDVVIHPGGRAMEARFHRKFSQYLIHGEWFKAVPAVLDEMRSLARSEDAITDWRGRVGDYADVQRHKSSA